MRLRTYIVDAFVVGGQPGTGNAAGVVLLPSIVPTSTSNDDDANGKTEAASPTGLDDDARQRLAAELRQTETAFVERGKSDSRNTFLLRWFTPTTEVPLCGHATLAAAAALVAEGVAGDCEEEEGEDEKQGEKTSNAGEDGKKTVYTTVYRFETVSSGLLKVRVRFPPASASSSSFSSAPTFELDLPSRPPTDPPPRGFRMEAAAEEPPSGSATTPATTALLRALCHGGGGGDGDGDDGGNKEPSLLRRLRGISFNAELGYLVVELEPGGGKERTSAAAAAELIEGLSPDPRALREAASFAEEEASSGNKESGGDKSSSSSSSSSSVSGVVVTSLDDDDDGEDVMLSRFFGPWMGIDEDPATGSAHAVLAPLWDGELRRRRRRRRRERGGAAAGDEDDSGPLFWRARQLSARGGELSVCFLEGRGRVLVAGGAAVALEGWAHV